MRRAVALGVLLLGCHGERSPSADGRLAAMRADHARLHAQLEQKIASDPLLRQAAGDPGQVVVALRARVVHRLIHDVARLYLHRVALDLSLEATVRAGGEVSKDTFVGPIKAGQWSVEVVIHRIRGVLRTAEPRVTTAGERLRIRLPVSIQESYGSATLSFKWDPTRVASVVCRAFDVTLPITGSVSPRDYTVEGEFALSAGPDAVVARPEFPDTAFKLSVDLSSGSWGEFRRILDGQDTLARCGLAMKSQDVMARLREVGQRGFDFRLPRSLFRPVRLPAAVKREVAVEDRTIELDARSNGLSVSSEGIWYSVSIVAAKGRASPGGSAATLETPSAPRPGARP